MKLRITSKLLLAILLTNVLIITVLALYLRAAFEHGFTDYLNQAEAGQLAPLVKSLAAWHEQGGEFADLQYDLRQWHELLLQSLPGVDRVGRPGDHRRREPGGPGDHRRHETGGPADNAALLTDELRPGPRHPPGRPPPPGGFDAGPPSREGFARERGRPPPSLSDPAGLVSRIRLLDADKQLILGAGYPSAGHTWLPVVSQQRTLAWLALAPSMLPMDGLAAQFQLRQERALMIIGMLAILVSALAVFFLTRNLLHPIRRLADGAHRLTAGAFETRIEVTSGDELGQLAGDFNKLARTLEANEQARRQWIADISHELRTPLAVLRGEIEALQDGVREPAPQRLRSLHAEVLSLGKLVNDLYELSLSDIGALTYHKQEINLVDVVREVVEGFRQRFTGKGIELHFDTANTPQARVFADAGRLEQLFNNLLENSLRYTDDAGEVRVFLELQKDTLYVNIQDSLPGVPVEMLPKLFDRLFRVDGSRSRVNGGAGLGLSICRSIVDAHEGRIEASASPAGGLWVSVQLPRVN